MSSTHSKPTIVFVQGSFQIPLVYQKLVKGLESNGHSVVCPPLPSCTGTNASDFPTRTLIDDALSVRRELIRLIEYESKKVVVVMHSYGGLVGSEAVSEDLSYSRRRSQGLSGGVIHLFYYSAFILPKGQSVLSAFGESPNNDVRVSNCTFHVSQVC
jgi:pimeloyl-ACP methyl ester carboxylesterase